MTTDIEDCANFLIKNGFSEITDREKNGNIRSFYKEGCIGIDLDEEDDEIVLINDSGDFFHAEANYFTLLGALLHYRQLGFNFKTK